MASGSVSDQPHAEAATSPSAMVDQLVTLAVRHIGEQLVAMAGRVSAALLDLSAPDEARQVYQRVKSGNLLKQNSYAFVHLAATGIEKALRAEAAQLAPAGKDAPEPSLDALSLVPLADMDSKVAFGVISRPFDIAHAEALATLNVRLGYLLERDILRPAQNPFRPDVLLAELDRAWREFEPDEAAHGLIQPLLVPDIVFDLGPLYDALNVALKRNGRQPAGAGKRHIHKTDDAAAAKAVRASDKAALAKQLRDFFGDGAAAAPDLALPMIPDLPDMPQGKGSWRPSAAGGFVAAPPAGAAGAPAAGGFVAAPPGAAAAAPVAVGMPMPGGAAPPLQFGELGLDLPPGVLAGAAPPAGAAAPAHGAALTVPASVAPLLELLARLPQPSAPTPAEPAAAVAAPGQVFYLPRLKQSLPRGSLSRGDESTLDLLSRIFETVFLDEAIPAPTRELIQSLQMPVLKAALVDKNFFFEEAHPARRMIDLLSRMGWDQRNDPDDPLFQAMQRSITKVERDGASQPEVFAEAVADLEHSLAADEQAREAEIALPVQLALRQERIALARRAATDAVALRLGSDDVMPVVGAFLEQRWRDVLTLAYDVEEKKPGAVNNATRAMDDLVWSVKPKATQEQRKALIARLPSLLTTINKWLDIIKWQDAERLQFFAALAECHASIVRAPIDLSPARQLELAVEAAQQDALRLVAQERAAAERAELDTGDAVTQTVEGLERGRWLEFAHDDGAPRRVKLVWVSPRRTLFIFSEGARKEAFSMASDALADAVRAGRAAILAREGVVGQVLSAAMLEAAGNDASAHAFA